MKVISVWNMKGGVGKTTLAYNLASELGRSGCDHNRVLGIDLDCQANLTSYFDRQNRAHSKASVQELANKNFAGIQKAIYHRSGHGIDYIRGTNSEVAVSAINMLQDALDKISDAYDYVVIDCPPMFDHCVQSAIYASDYVLVPIALDAFSRDNLNLVQSDINMIEQVKELNELDPDSEDQIDIAWGVVANRVANRKSQKEVFRDLLDKHDYPILDICISESSMVSSANLMHKPIAAHRSTSAVAQDVAELVKLVKKEVC